MKNFQRSAIFLCLALVVGILFFFIFPPGPPDPIYEGKPLSVWLKEYDLIFTGAIPSPRIKADEAVNYAGTNAIPLLLEMMQKKDSPYPARLLGFLKKLPWIKLHSYGLHNSQLEAAMALEAMGPKASNAVPGLMRVYTNNPPVRSSIIYAFALIGPSADEAVPLLVAAAETTNSHIRGAAVYALTKIHTRPEIVVPLLTRLLNDPSSLKYGAAAGLAEYGEKALEAESALIKALKGNDEEMKQRARQTLLRIDPYWNEGKSVLDK